MGNQGGLYFHTEIIPHYPGSTPCVMRALGKDSTDELRYMYGEFKFVLPPHLAAG